MLRGVAAMTHPGADPLHPRHALFASSAGPPVIPVCDHYAGTEDLMVKALALQARSPHVFDVTLDLEDGAPAGREAAHARRVVELLRTATTGRVGVRIHDPGSPHWQRDLETLVAGAGDRIAHLTVPKSDGARPLAAVLDFLRQACRRAGLPTPIAVHALFETHGALAEAQALAALPGLRGLDFGIMDFVSSHHGAIPIEAMASPLQFEHALVARAKATQVAAALAHDLVPVHGVTLALRDPAQVHADAVRARREFGYLRMWSIHPSQIEPICRAFAADHAEVERAGRVLLAARHADWGPIDLDGRLYDRASYRAFWRVLQRARLDGLALPDEVEARFFGDDRPTRVPAG